MGVRLTGITTPLGGATWEYTDDNAEKQLSLVSNKKIRVFISSNCGIEKYDRVRAELKKDIEKTGIADVYVFESEEASSLPAGSHYLYALEDCDICIFLIDNYDGVGPGVQAEIDKANKLDKKALYYFCDELSAEQTPLQKSLTGAQFSKSKTVHKFEELSKDGAKALIDDILTVYHNYCMGRLNFSEDEDATQNVRPTVAEKQGLPIIPKVVLKNVDKCRNYLKSFILGYFREQPVENTCELDDWGFQFLQILLDNNSIKQFNVAIFLDALSSLHNDDYHKVVSLRWEAIQAYYSDNTKLCVEKLRKALTYAKESGQPTWVINDILIDIRNQHWNLCNIENRFYNPSEQEELLQCEESIYNPVLDRIHESLHENYIEGLYDKKIESPYSITYGSNINQSSEMLASSLIVSMCNGSLTHIILFYNELKSFLFYLCCKYDNWILRLNLFKTAVITGKEKEINGVRNSYPEILNKLSSEDAASVMHFCQNIPTKHNRLVCQYLAFGAVGYYLSDDKFKETSDMLVSEMLSWFDYKYGVATLGYSIIKGFSGVGERLSQKTLCEICCVFMDHNYQRYYIELFRFIESHIDLNQMDRASAERLVNSISALFSNDKGWEQIKYSPHFLSVLRNQNAELTEKLDGYVKEHLPHYYENDYKINTTDIENQNIPEIINKYINKIKQSNTTQGKNGAFFQHGEREIDFIRRLIQINNIEIDAALFKSTIESVVETLVISKENIEVKNDAIKLLFCIVLRYPEVFRDNVSEYEELYNKRAEIENNFDYVIESNIDSVALKIGLQFLFLAMGKDVYSSIIELMPYVMDDVATSIETCKIIHVYLSSNESIILPAEVEPLVLQTCLQWLRSDNTDLRWNALRVLFMMLRNPKNTGVINHQIVNLIDIDNMYIKYFILHNLNSTPGITDSTKDYIFSKCENDSNYVVRKFCKELKEA